MYAVDGDLPAVETIGARNCTGLTNLMLRAIGVVLPYDNAVALRPTRRVRALCGEVLTKFGDSHCLFWL